MAFRIDPDAIPLYKELKPVHARLKKALKDKSSTHVEKCLSSVFGSSLDRSAVTDKDYNTHEAMSWMCPIPARSIGAIFQASAVVHLDDDSNTTHLVMKDNWIYGALLPLGLKIDLHTAWMKQLGYVIETLKQTPGQRLPAFNVWDQKTMIEHIGFCMGEDARGNATIFEVSPPEALALRSAVNLLLQEPERAMHKWPDFAPWLNAMQTLTPSPALDHQDTKSWQSWADTLKNIYLHDSANSAIALPESFSQIESNVNSSYV